jgi:hypothetical protein
MNSMVGKVTKNHVRVVLFHSLLPEEMKSDDQFSCVEFYALKLKPETYSGWSDFILNVHWCSFKIEGNEVYQINWNAANRWKRTHNTRLKPHEIEQVKEAVITIPCEWRLSQ